MGKPYAHSATPRLKGKTVRRGPMESKSIDDWAFFRAGNANALFSYNGSDPSLADTLLRLRLRKKEGEYVSTREVYEFITDTGYTRIPEVVNHCRLIRIHPKLMKSFIARGYDLMPSEDFGLVIQNLLSWPHESLKLSKNCYVHIKTLTENDGVPTITLELKPKWLYDCTTLYCRNCSLKQLKAQDRHFCPLDFVQGESIPEGVQDFTSHIPDSFAARIKQQFDCSLGSLMEDYLISELNVFRKLKNLQSIEIPPLLTLNDPDDTPEELLRLMSLRDVSCFIRLERISNAGKHENWICDGSVGFLQNGSVKASSFVLDLDPKPRSKLKYWQSIEKRLLPIYNRDNPDWKHCQKQAAT